MSKLPFIKINNIKYIHPKFITIDIFRMYTDPLTSYWRLKKNLLRANKLLQYYPFKIKVDKYKEKKINTNIKKILDYIKTNIINKDKYVIFGNYAYKIFKNLGKDVSNYTNFDLISLDLKNDCLEIYKQLQKINKEIKYVEYHPFFQFFDTHISFKLNDYILLNVYGNNKKCVPYIKIGKVNFCSYQFLLMTFLINHYYNKFYDNYIEANNNDYMIKDLINIRNNFLKKNKKNLFDKTIFREFVLEYKGSGINPHIEWQKNIKEKIKQKKRIKFIYDPIKSKLDKINFIFKNSSGRINSSKYRIMS